MFYKVARKVGMYGLMVSLHALSRASAVILQVIVVLAMFYDTVILSTK